MKDLLILLLSIALIISVCVSNERQKVQEQIWNKRVETKVYQVNDLIHALEDCQNGNLCQMPVLIKEN